MNEVVTLEQVVSFAELLSMQDQLRLMSRVSEHLSKHVPEQRSFQQANAADNPARLRLAEQLLLEVQDTPDDAPGMLDSAAAVRQMRNERHR